ncbi:MAG TPA: VanZ family protein [Luteolibacter sp.]
MKRPHTHPLAWLALWAVWSAVLWKLSSGPMPMQIGPEIPFFDKICHFGYFFGGAGLLSAFLFRLSPDRPRWTLILTVCLLAGLAVGRLDEWHQTWIPGRSGNDIDDFLADLLGTLAGYWTFRASHRALK